LALHSSEGKGGKGSNKSKPLHNQSEKGTDMGKGSKDKGIGTDKGCKGQDHNGKGQDKDTAKGQGTKSKGPTSPMRRGRGHGQGSQGQNPTPAKRRWVRITDGRTLESDFQGPYIEVWSCFVYCSDKVGTLLPRLARVFHVEDQPTAITLFDNMGTINPETLWGDWATWEIELTMGFRTEVFQ